jgi:glycosyltransferase involved in cell wall biosynthesis
LPEVATTETDTEEPGSAGRWLNLVAHLDPKYGGISAVMPSFCNSVSGEGTEAALLPLCHSDETYDTSLCLPLDVLPLGFKEWLTNSELRHCLRDQIQESAGVHIHGIWQEHCLFGAQAARSLHKPYVISAHGMLDPWALRNKGWKKRLYSALIERRNVTDAACLHALTAREAEEYRSFGADGPVAVIPNGVRVPHSIEPSLFFKSFPELKGKRILLYLSRLHFKKGLDLLCRAWKNAGHTDDHHLVLAGPDFEDTRQRLEEMISELGVGRSITFAGMLKDEHKWAALAACDAFILPSRSEGLSVAVLEAMAMGRPVIVTSRCNVPEVATHSCGWTTEPDQEDVTETLREYFAAGPETLLRMGENGKRVAKKVYTWESVGRRISDVYRWLAAGARVSEAPVDVDIRSGNRVKA